MRNKQLSGVYPAARTGQLISSISHSGLGRGDGPLPFPCHTCMVITYNTDGSRSRGAETIPAHSHPGTSSLQRISALGISHPLKHESSNSQSTTIVSFPVLLLPTDDVQLFSFNVQSGNYSISPCHSDIGIGTPLAMNILWDDLCVRRGPIFV